MKMIYLAILLVLVSCGQGDTGAKGDAGERGIRGTDGSSCWVISISNGARVQCPDGSETVILNGTNGSNGTNGTNATPSAYTVTEIIDPCGDQLNKFDEVLLKTSNNTILAHYSQGGKEFLTILAPGSYVTTDFQSCNFTIAAGGIVTW